MVGEVEGGVGKASEDAVPFEHGCLPAAWPDVHEITVDVQLVPEEERRYKPILVSRLPLTYSLYLDRGAFGG